MSYYNKVLNLERSIKSELVKSSKSFSNIKGKENIRKAFSEKRLRQLLKLKDFIHNYEDYVLANYIDGYRIRLDKIEPKLEQVRTEEQKIIFKYCRLLSSYPYSQNVGRKLEFIIRDLNPKNMPIMGILSLGSAVRNLKVRDDWIGWTGRENLEVKKKFLGNIMDLYIAIGIPPYSKLLSGKLIALISLTNEVRKFFSQKYPSSKYLALITTTSLYGRNCSQYNRIKFNDTKFFNLLGETKGYGHIHIPDDIYEKMKIYLKLLGLKISYDIKEGYNYKFKIISRAIRCLGLSEQQFLNHNIRKGIFVSPLASNCNEYLMGRIDKPNFYEIELNNIIKFWKERWLKMRIKNDSIIHEVNNFKKNSIRISNLINNFS